MKKRVKKIKDNFKKSSRKKQAQTKHNKKSVKNKKSKKIKSKVPRPIGFERKSKKDGKKRDNKYFKNEKNQEKEEFIKTGIIGFDSLFKDKKRGIPEGSSILVEGGPGSGKTIFCLSTLVNLCKNNKKALYMSFEEPEEKLIQHMENFGWPAKKWVKEGLLRVQRFDALDVSRSIEALLSAAKKELLIEIDPVFFPKDFSPNFVVIDSLTSIASAFSGQESRFRIYMEQLFRYLEKNKITNFLVREVSSPSHIGTTFKEQGEAVSFLSDGIIVIYNVIYDSGRRTSAIEILKMRGVNFEKKIVELEIKPKGGIVVYPKKVLKRTRASGFNLT